MKKIIQIVQSLYSPLSRGDALRAEGFKSLIITLSLFTFYVLRITYYATPAYAIISNPVINNGAAQATAPEAYFNSVLQAVIAIFFIVAVIYFIWHIVFAGYHLIASEGDPKRWEAAKNEIIYAFVGLFAVFSIFAIVKFIGTVLGITGLSNLTITWPSL